MANRRHNPCLVKHHRSYTVEEIAYLLAVHKNTVRGWIKAGLPVIDKRRPTLVLGQDLAAFLRTQRTKNKQTCQPGQIYCLRCRAPRCPPGGTADFLVVTNKMGTLKAICPDCHSPMNRHVSLSRLANDRGSLIVTFTQAPSRVSDSGQALVNSDFK
jgi:hypothetical protein